MTATGEEWKSKSQRPSSSCSYGVEPINGWVGEDTTQLVPAIWLIEAMFFGGYSQSTSLVWVTGHRLTWLKDLRTSGPRAHSPSHCFEVSGRRKATVALRVAPP